MNTLLEMLAFEVVKNMELPDLEEVYSKQDFFTLAVDTLLDRDFPIKEDLELSSLEFFKYPIEYWEAIGNKHASIFRVLLVEILLVSKNEIST